MFDGGCGPVGGSVDPANGRYHVSYDDIRALAHPVLRHRVLTNFRAESEGITSDSIIDELLTAAAMVKKLGRG